MVGVGAAAAAHPGTRLDHYNRWYKLGPCAHLFSEALVGAVTVLLELPVDGAGATRPCCLPSRTLYFRRQAHCQSCSCKAWRRSRWSVRKDGEQVGQGAMVSLCVFVVFTSVSESPTSQFCGMGSEALRKAAVHHVLGFDWKPENRTQQTRGEPHNRMISQARGCDTSQPSLS